MCIRDSYGITPTTPVSGIPLGATGSDRVRVSVGRDKEFRPLFGADRNGHRLLYHWDGTRSYHQTPNDPEETVDLYDASSEDIGCLWEQLLPVVESIDSSTLGPAVSPGP